MTHIPELNTSWLHGKYEAGEINVNTSYVHFYEPDFFAQGNDADEIIDQIHEIWILNDVSVNEAMEIWMFKYL